MKSNQPYIESRIRDCQIRLVDTSDVIEKNKYYQSISMTEASNIAKASGMDLVCFGQSSKDKLAFYKILDFGKWKYEESKQKKKQQKQNKKDTKEIRLSPLIADHDVEHKVKQANEFIANGDDVLFTMKIKGRQRIYADEAKSKIIQVANKCENIEITSKQLDGNAYLAVRVTAGKK